VKAEYDLSTMKRKGHPLRKKVARGEVTLINPFDIPSREAKLSVLSSDERASVVDFLKTWDDIEEDDPTLDENKVIEEYLTSK